MIARCEEPLVQDAGHEEEEGFVAQLSKLVFHFKVEILGEPLEEDESSLVAHSFRRTSSISAPRPGRRRKHQEHTQNPHCFSGYTNLS